jgi:hypothetical protein
VKKGISQLLISFLLMNILLVMGLPSRALADPLTPPTLADVSASLTKWANQYNIPPVVLKAVAWQESGWSQFKDGNPLTPLIGYDGVGIGIMQISTYDPNDPTQADYITKLKTDYDFNISEGARILNQKWRTVPKTGDGDRNKLENWYFAVWAYNGWSNKNNPNYATSQKLVPYQSKVFALMGRKYNSTITLTYPTTIPDPSTLPQAPVVQSLPPNWSPSYLSTWGTPTPYHLGDLVINPTLLLSGGGSVDEPANGDYWLKFQLDHPTVPTAIYSLGYYVTGYNATTGTDRDTFTTKLISAAKDVTAYAASRLNSAQSLDDVQVARKWFWAVLQLPNLDSTTWQKAQDGYNQALQKTFRRLGGKGREDTAISIAEEGWPHGAGTVILSASEDAAWPDALTSTPLAKKYDAPLLITPSTVLLPQVSAELAKLHPQTIVIVGGWISPAIEQTLAKTYTVQRLSGKDRYETSVKVAEALGLGSDKTVFIATGEAAPDALTVAPIAAQLQQPILLTPPTGIPASVNTFLSANQVQTLNVVGGTGVIPTKILPGQFSFKRYGGADRFLTMQAILEGFRPSLPNLFFTNGSGNVFADALAGGPLVAKLGGALLLTGNQTLGNVTRDYLRQVRGYATFTPDTGTVGRFYQLGGSSVLSLDSDLTANLLP